MAELPFGIIRNNYDKSANAAIQQIKDRHYTQALEGDVGEIVLVGIKYDKKTARTPHIGMIARGT